MNDSPPMLVAASDVAYAGPFVRQSRRAHMSCTAEARPMERGEAIRPLPPMSG